MYWRKILSIAVVFSIITVCDIYILVVYFLFSGCLFSILFICSRNGNVMYSVFVITALKSWNLSLPRWNGHPITTAKFFGPIADHINWVPLYQNVMCKIYCVGWFLFMTDLVNTEWHTCISASCRLYAANTALAHPRYYWCKVLFVCVFLKKNASYRCIVQYTLRKKNDYQL